MTKLEPINLTFSDAKPTLWLTTLLLHLALPLGWWVPLGNSLLFPSAAHLLCPSLLYLWGPVLDLLILQPVTAKTAKKAQLVSCQLKCYPCRSPVVSSGLQGHGPQ